MWDLVNRETGEVRSYSSEALANYMQARLGGDWYVVRMY